MARRTAWEDTLIDQDVASSGQNNQQLMNNLVQDERRGLTVVRWIGELSLNSLTVAGAYGVMKLALGITMLDADAAAAGAFPDPNQALDKPPRGWVYRTQCGVSQNGVGTPIITRCTFDIRAMRRFEGSVAYLIIDNNSSVGTSFTTQVHGYIRCLTLLP